MSFLELREALVYAFSDWVISEEEFLILYEEYESTNLNFPHWEYEEDIPLLVNALQVPEYFRCPQGTGKAFRGGRGSDPVKKVNIIFNNKQINN